MAKGFFSRVIEAVAEKSKDVIERLLQLPGVTKAKIAKSLGIDSSTISQIEKGKKPGANLAPELLKLERDVSGAEKPGQAIADIHLEPPKRLTREGEPAAVRKSKAEIEAEAALELPPAGQGKAIAAGGEGLTVTIKGLIGSSDDFRNRTISADFDPDEAVDFLAMWDVDRAQAYELFWEAASYPLLTVKRLDSVRFE